MYSKDKMETFSVLIPDGESIHALNVLRCLGQIKNIRSYILSNDPWAPIRFSRYSTKFFSYDNEKDNEGRLAAINDTVKENKVDVVLPVDFQTIRLLSMNKGALPPFTSIAPVPQTDALDIAADKWLLSGWLKENQIPCPPTILYQTYEGFDQALSALSFPVLIKPRNGSGGAGIKLFDNPTGLYSFCKKNISPGEYIVQSFLTGHDIDCSVLCLEGEILAFTFQKEFLEGPYNFARPSGIDLLYDGCTHDIVRELIKKINWSGIVHIDLRYDQRDKQVKVIEMNPRFWGSVLGSFCAGANFPYLACLSGLKLDLPKIVVQPKRFVRGISAIKIKTQRLLFANRKDLYFDNSMLEFILKDPFPNVIDGYFKICNKFTSRK